MSYKQGYFGGASQVIETFDNIERNYKQGYFGATVGAQELSLWDKPRVPVLPPSSLAWNLHPTTGTIGTDVTYSWKDGAAPYNVVVTNPAGTEHDNVNLPTATTYKLTTVAGDAAGKYNVTVNDAGGKSITQDVTMSAAALKTFKVVDGTATGYSAGAIALTSADGMKTLIATDSADAAVAGLSVALTTAGDSTKLGVALNADGKTIEMTPVAAATGAVKFKLTATGYTTLEITATLS